MTAIPWLARDAGCWLFRHAAYNQTLLAAYRWLHFLSVTAFVGLLLFLNLLLPEFRFGGGLDKGLLKRVFWLWRWSMMLALFTGLNLLHMLYDFPTGNFFDGDKGLWMALGAGLGFFTWLVVWGWIWPAQKRHFERWPEDGSWFEPLANRSAWGIRTVTVLLPALVMGMAVGGHGLTLFSWGWRDVAWTVGLACLPLVGLYGFFARRHLGRT